MAFQADRKCSFVPIGSLRGYPASVGVADCLSSGLYSFSTFGFKPATRARTDISALFSNLIVSYSKGSTFVGILKSYASGFLAIIAAERK